MAMGGGTRGRIVSEINVTPMADVMIVLLVIFMIATPFLDDTRGLTLPDAANATMHDEDRGPVVVVLRDDGGVSLGDQPADVMTLVFRLRERLERRVGAARIVHLKAGRDLPYARVREVLRACREADAEQVVLVTDPKLRS
jgi:biopolymer transport protein ExbD